MRRCAEPDGARDRGPPERSRPPRQPDGRGRAGGRDVRRCVRRRAEPRERRSRARAARRAGGRGRCDRRRSGRSGRAGSPLRLRGRAASPSKAKPRASSRICGQNSSPSTWAIRLRTCRPARRTRFLAAGSEIPKWLAISGTVRPRPKRRRIVSRYPARIRARASCRRTTLSRLSARSASAGADSGIAAAASSPTVWGRAARARNRSMDALWTLVRNSARRLSAPIPRPARSCRRINTSATTSSASARESSEPKRRSAYASPSGRRRSHSRSKRRARRRPAAEAASISGHANAPQRHGARERAGQSSACPAFHTHRQTAASRKAARPKPIGPRTSGYRLLVVFLLSAAAAAPFPARQEVDAVGGDAVFAALLAALLVFPFAHPQAAADGDVTALGEMLLAAGSPGGRRRQR